MVQFGTTILESRHDPWANAYLDYDGLKLALKQLGQLSPVQEDPGVNGYHSEDFELLLNDQIEKVVLFFLDKQGELARRLRDLRNNVNQQNPKTLAKEYQLVGEELVQLVNFVELNVTGLRKILKKHDKKFYRYPITHRYLSNYVQGEDSHLQQMYHYGGMSALAETLKRGLQDLQRAKMLGGLPDLEYSNVSSGTDYSALSPSQHVSPILYQIDEARSRLQHSSQYAKAMAAQALIFDEASDSGTFMVIQVPSRRGISSALNLLSTFLYMTNYYIVAPTSGSYAERLGRSEALSGFIIGLTPVAALGASILYSWWTNHSYKNALLFAAACSFLGDVLYALALPMKSFHYILIARLLNGFGGARAINRRYIADAFTRSERTSASAAFVASGALGLASGPALAVAANHIIDRYVGDDNEWLSDETAPGYIMSVLWFCYLISAYLFFEEPEHGTRKEVELAGLEEQRPLIRNGVVVCGYADVKNTPSLLANLPVMLTMASYLVLKLVLECLLSSTATVTGYYFDWDVPESGLFLSILGLLMFPANAVIAILSSRWEDREIMLPTQVIVLVGSLGIIAYSQENYSAIQYIVFGLCIFLGTNMLEAPTMSLLSKTIPRRWAKGTWNSGLLATEAGTLGRAIGDVMVSSAGLVGLERMLELTYAPVSVAVVLLIIFTWRLFPLLEPDDEDDD